jgi:hypothetical protein
MAISELLSVMIHPIISKPKAEATFSKEGEKGSSNNSQLLIVPFYGGS